VNKENGVFYVVFIQAGTEQNEQRLHAGAGGCFTIHMATLTSLPCLTNSCQENRTNFGSGPFAGTGGVPATKMLLPF
jgi:hypothetical protein